MSIIYFDICSIPLFLMILYICHSRKMIKGTANQLFIVVVLLSLFSAAADLCMETAEEVELLKSMNCDYIQGFYFSRPLPAADFIRCVEEKNGRPSPGAPG